MNSPYTWYAYSCCTLYNNYWDYFYFWLANSFKCFLSSNIIKLFFELVSQLTWISQVSSAIRLVESMLTNGLTDWASKTDHFFQSIKYLLNFEWKLANRLRGVKSRKITNILLSNHRNSPFFIDNKFAPYLEILSFFSFRFSLPILISQVSPRPMTGPLFLDDVILIKKGKIA